MVNRNVLIRLKGEFVFIDQIARTVTAKQSCIVQHKIWNLKWTEACFWPQQRIGCGLSIAEPAAAKPANVANIGAIHRQQ